MGYCYCARTGRLACDACGAANGKTRKRTCPHRVHYAEGGSLPYCQPAALCPDCYAKHKPTLHDGCKDAAARETQRQQDRAAMLDAGQFERKTAWGDWHELVPSGHVGVRFVNRAGQERYRLLTDEQYKAVGDWLSDVPASALLWEPHA